MSAWQVDEISSDGVELADMHWWHLPEVLRLEEELFAPESWSQELFWSELAFCSPTLEGPPLRRYLVVLQGTGAEQRVLGYAGLAYSDDPQQRPAESYVQTVGVGRRWQRHGYGGRLVRTMLDLSRDAGCRTCWLEVRVDNAGAQSLYRRLGFTGRGVRRGYYQPSNTDALVMAAEL